jgi:hypothetical protein
MRHLEIDLENADKIPILTNTYQVSSKEKEKNSQNSYIAK